MPASDYTDFAAAKGLVPAASLWAEKAKQKAKTRAIRAGMKVGSVVNDGEGRYHIDITNSAPEAAAYEYGSGLHGRMRAKYPILPRNARFLAIPRSRWPNYLPPPDVDPVILPKVMHPGVKPEPFMQPALEENKDEMRRLIGKAFAVEMIHKSIREIFHVD